MKQRARQWIVLFLLLAAGAPEAFGSPPSYQSFVAFLAGAELLTTSKSLSRLQAAARYRRLCALTGVTGTKARDFVLAYKNDPVGWQKVRTDVLDALSAPAVKEDRKKL